MLTAAANNNINKNIETIDHNLRNVKHNTKVSFPNNLPSLNNQNTNTKNEFAMTTQSSTSSTASRSELTLNSSSSQAIGKVFQECTMKINGIDFYKNGNFLICSSDDHSIHLYDSFEAELKKTIYSKKYGVSLIRFTHDVQTIICASNNNFNDHDIRYLSLYDNQYLRFFKGHKNKVISLNLAPKLDAFISGAIDGEVRLQDLKSKFSQALLKNDDWPVVSFDPESLIFAVGGSNGNIRLYDFRNYKQGPFSTFKYTSKLSPNNSHLKANLSSTDAQTLKQTSIEFSSDGKLFALANNYKQICLMDSFNGSVVNEFNIPSNFKNNTFDLKGFCPSCSISADSTQIIAGSSDGNVYLYDIAGNKLGNNDINSDASFSFQPISLSGHLSPVNFVKQNPTSMCFASSCTNLALQLPESDSTVIQNNDLQSSVTKATKNRKPISSILKKNDQQKNPILIDHSRLDLVSNSEDSFFESGFYSFGNSFSLGPNSYADQAQLQEQQLSMFNNYKEKKDDELEISKQNTDLSFKRNIKNDNIISDSFEIKNLSTKKEIEIDNENIKSQSSINNSKRDHCEGHINNIPNSNSDDFINNEHDKNFCSNAKNINNSKIQI